MSGSASFDKMIKFVTLFLIVGLVSAEDQVVNINSQIDEGLTLVNKILTERGLGLRPLPPSRYDDVELSNGVQLGLNSMSRIGDATVTISEDNKHYVVDYSIGFRLLVVAYGDVKYAGDEFSGLYRVRDNLFHVSFTAVNDTSCSVHLVDYQFDKFDKATVQSSLAKYDDQDVSEVFSQYVMPRVNEKVSHLKPLVQEIIQEQFCHRPSFLTDTNEHLISHLKHLLRAY